MDHHAYAPLTSARVTIASILLTTMLVQSLPLLPYGHYTMRDLSRRFSPSSSSSSSSASSSSPSDSSGPSAASLKDEMADLDGLSPQDAYLLALSLSLEKGDSGSAKALHNRASAPFNSNIYEKRPSKRFDFGQSARTRDRRVSADLIRADSIATVRSTPPAPWYEYLHTGFNHLILADNSATYSHYLASASSDL
ncbi:hypothetical protein PoB_006813900 [Plakobranchus ocellatus]|uniref:Uncharacterized protein n=1 Tax=Plakobranchus ocellatus TaxID=259542 RepID=A0AAV4DBP8_9GAST|nr:hypothetical protein PoB_006813900 [Plakobranchus ocellatus]